MIKTQKKKTDVYRKKKMNKIYLIKENRIFFTEQKGDPK